MKKTVIAILLISILLVSCGISHTERESFKNLVENKSSDESTTEPTESVGYNVKLTSYIEGGIFKDSVEVYQIDKSSIENMSEPIESTVSLGKQEISANLISKEHYAHKSQQNVYLSKDKNTEYVISEDFTSFSIIAQNSSVLLPFTANILTEDEIVKNIQDYISTYVDIDILEEYRYSCSTKIVTVKPNAAWKETRDGFWTSQDETESVSSYVIEYNKYCQDYPTADRIVVNCNYNGDISSLYYCKYDVAWENVEFENTQIAQSVEKYLHKIIATDYNISEYNIESQRLVFVNDIVQLALSVAVTLDKGYGKMVVLCPLLISN